MPGVFVVHETVERVRPADGRDGGLVLGSDRSNRSVLRGCSHNAELVARLVGGLRVPLPCLTVDQLPELLSQHCAGCEPGTAAGGQLRAAALHARKSELMETVVLRGTPVSAAPTSAAKGTYCLSLQAPASPWPRDSSEIYQVTK